MDGMSIVFISDLHNKEYGRGNSLLLEAINDISPDLVLVGGDMMVSKGKGDIRPSVSFLKRLSRKYPVYAGMGNHELRMERETLIYGSLYQQYITSIKKLGVISLENESKIFSRGNDAIQIVGLNIPKFYYHKITKPAMEPSFLTESVGCADKDLFCILLAHLPRYFSSYVKWGADLTLSGHYHGGMIRLPGLGGMITSELELFPRYDLGRYTWKNKTMIVSAGLGEHSIKLRINNPPQLVCVTLKKGIRQHGIIR